VGENVCRSTHGSQREARARYAGKPTSGEWTLETLLWSPIQFNVAPNSEAGARRRLRADTLGQGGRLLSLEYPLQALLRTQSADLMVDATFKFIPTQIIQVSAIDKQPLWAKPLVRASNPQRSRFTRAPTVQALMARAFPAFASPMAPTFRTATELPYC
jgi:hypothetical protein